MKYALLAGNGRFPILALEEARHLGHKVVVIALKEEADPQVTELAWRSHWISIGQLSRLIEILHEEELTELVMAGQVKHARIFSSLRPDWRLAKLLFSLKGKNTDALIGGVAEVLASEGIRLVDSTFLLKPLLADTGPMARRRLTDEEERDVRYGRGVANALSGFDVGQSVAVSDRACVALEAMEGTDAMLRRAASLCDGKPLRLIKASRRRGHLLFDVPVVGLATIQVMQETHTTVIAVDAGRTLLLDRADLMQAADRAGIAVVGFPPEDAHG